MTDIRIVTQILKRKKNIKIKRKKNNLAALTINNKKDYSGLYIEYVN